ncbi:MAG: YibE/F family protein [Eubacterium sp.]|jgi:uncharacterized membrane protein
MGHQKLGKNRTNPLNDTRFIVLLIAAALSAILFMIPDASRYTVLETSTRRYVRCKVISVEETDTQETSKYSGMTVGTQTVTVEIDGKTVEIVNNLSDTHHIEVKPGSRVVVCVDEPDNTEPYYTIANYDRTGVEIGILAFFALILILTGGMRGVYALAALAFSVIFLFKVTIPAIYSGQPVLTVTAAAVIIITPVSICLISGVNKKSAVSAAAVFVGEAAAAVIFSIFSAVLHISGFVDENVDGLLLVTYATGMDLSHLLFAAAMISSLGAVMDVAVSLVAALFEIHDKNPLLGRRELFASGMNVGRDMMGTMSNTLIFAFFGSALSMLLVLYSYGVQTLALLTSDFIAVELAHGICGTAAVILTVPLSALLSSLALTRGKQPSLSKSGGKQVPQAVSPEKQTPHGDEKQVPHGDEKQVPVSISPEKQSL